jgi:hypothetical protein
MAKDFPDDKYDYRLKPEMRSFSAVIVHIASGNVYAAKAGRGEMSIGMSWTRRTTKRRPLSSRFWKSLSRTRTPL